MELAHVVGIASALGGGCPVAFVCGQPPHILASAAWSEELTPGACALWRACRSERIIKLAPLTGFPTCARDDRKSLIGVLVVATDAGAGLREHFMALARVIEHADSSLLADLVRRLQDHDPSARPDLLDLLRRHNFNICVSARALGVSRWTLYKHLNRLEIRIDRVPAALRDDGLGGDLEQG